MSRQLAASKSVTRALYGTAIMVASLLAATVSPMWFFVVAALGMLLIQSAVCPACRGNG